MSRVILRFIYRTTNKHIQLNSPLIYQYHNLKLLSYSRCSRALLELKNRDDYKSIIRHKFTKKSSSRDDEDSDNENDLKEFETEIDGNDSKLVRAKVNSLRTDLLIKAGLNMARNKVEAAFYENRIRVNGRKIQKKSIPLTLGDEVDVIKGVSPKNPEHLIVSRIEILDIKPNEEDITVALRRFKTFTIENYTGADMWKSGNTDLS